LFRIKSISLTNYCLDPASGRIQLAQRLLEMVPPDLASISEPEDRATEYLHYRQFFLIWETLEKVVECQSAHVPGLSKDENITWLAEYRVSFIASSKMPLF
jgi:nuclear pore complex protein Nup107